MSGRAPLYLADLERCQPGAAISGDARRHHWRAIPYESDLASGTMLVATAETVAPEIVYPLEVRGWHEISIGMYAGNYGTGSSIQVRLSDDPCFCHP